MLEGIFGLAILGVSMYFKAKDKDSNWNERSFVEKAGKARDVAEDEMNDIIERQKKNISKTLRTKSDNEILSLLEKYEGSDWQYESVYVEAERRGIL